MILEQQLVVIAHCFQLPASFSLPAPVLLFQWLALDDLVLVNCLADVRQLRQLRFLWHFAPLLGPCLAEACAVRVHLLCYQYFAEPAFIVQHLATRAIACFSIRSAQFIA